MRTSADMYMTQVNKSKQIQAGFRKTQRLLSLMVIVCVFWGLKLTGITMAGEAFCGMEEHVHTETCAMQEAICGQEESEGHVHTQDCLQKTLNCGFTEQPGHSHSEDCSGATLICTQEETEGHSHTEECFQQTLTCTTPEQAMHIHGADCYTQTFTCGLEENENHQHDETCSIVCLSCDLPESAGHSHGADCYDKTAVCGKEEAEGHIHSDGCYSTETSYLCGMEEVQEHFHTDACYVIEEETYICGLEEKEGHSHTATCYESQESCTLEEHIHTPNCYSDISADLETSEAWEDSLSDLVRVSNAPGNLVIVARSQLDMTESSRNFQVDEFGIRRGITRYGQWYGNPYGDWSAMFVSFCLDYAGIKDMPLNAGVESMRLEWEAEEFYAPAEEWVPTAGDLLFLDKNEDGAADAVAIVTDLKENVIFAIEGDIHDPVSQIGSVELHPEPEVISFEMRKETILLYETTEATTVEDVVFEGFSQETDSVEDCVAMEEAPLDRVAETLYAIEDPVIMGYGLVPIGGDYATLAAGDPCYIWLDGTDGGISYLTGSPNTCYGVKEGEILQLPTEWISPKKYSYKLRGWYDITNSVYYEPGEEMTVKGNAVLYADWVASTYDIGIFNAQVADTVSTNSFITTHLFDYNYLFNLHSATVQGSISEGSHSENWSMVTSGNVAHGGRATLDYIFADSDGTGRLSNPNNRSPRNSYRNADTVTTGIYSEDMGNILFGTNNIFNPETGDGILGKTYLGTGDHLFQIMDDPNDEHYGYYYYDSRRNAASFNESSGRFYVYEYLAATADSIGNGKANSDFLPLNSPYANTNDNVVNTYTYAGVNNEYQGIRHNRYEAKYSANNDYANTDYAYGMRSDIQFYIPNEPGTNGNKDLYGNPIEFEFSGDDDMWVLIDGIVVLDIGGIHQRVAGSINFSTGEVLVNGAKKSSLQDLDIGSGDHTLTVLYLERGASMSNCSIYFNIVPRYGLQIQKEDVLTQELLDGTQFTVYEDPSCEEETKAQLWESEAAYWKDLDDGIIDQAKSTFTVTGGVAKIWGLGSGNTYYIRETREPNADGYGLPDGVIRLSVEKGGLATYNVDVVPDSDGNTPSNGFTVHGVQIDETTQTVYIVVTNAPQAVVDATTVQVIKKWEDKEDHSNDYITAYLTVTDPDGTVRRIREVTLSDENKWHYTWTNLPKLDYDTQAEVKYGIEESYESGYYSTVRRITQIEISTTEWAEAGSFVNEDTYILRSSSGYLSTTSANDGKLKWVNEATAQSSELAIWTATVSGMGSTAKVKLTNGAGQILTFNYNNNRNNRYFHAITGSATYQTFTPVDAGSGFRLYATRNRTNYYMVSSGINNKGQIPTTTNSSSGLVLTPMEKITDSDVQQVKDWAYQITNTPLEAGNETSMTVEKIWEIPEGYSEKIYQEYAVTVQLLANGVHTGRNVVLNLKNNWTAAFLGLPYKDENGNVISYTVKESWDQKDWKTTYGEITVSKDTPPCYSTVITNTYTPGGPVLPSTGTAARLLYVLFGGSIMLTSLAYGIVVRNKRERRVR